MQNGIPEDHSMIFLCSSYHSASQVDPANFRFQWCRFSETHLTDKKIRNTRAVLYTVCFYRFFMYLLNSDTSRFGSRKAGEVKDTE